MIGVLFVALFQAAAGQPAPVPTDAAAPAATTATPAVPADESARDAQLRKNRERQKLVCRYETVLGSRVPTRRCTSAADDAAAGSDSRAWIDRVQSQMPTKGT